MFTKYQSNTDILRHQLTHENCSCNRLDKVNLQYGCTVVLSDELQCQTLSST